MLKKFKILILFLVIAVIAFTAAQEVYAVGDVIEIYFEPSVNALERNHNGDGNYDIDVKIRDLRDDGLPVNIAAVNLDFNYDIDYFKGTPIIINDHMTDNLFSGESSVDVPGLVHYEKIIDSEGAPTYLAINDEGSRTIFTLRFSVTNNSSLDSTSTVFDFKDSEVEVVIRGNPEAPSTTWVNGSYTITRDAAAPDISADPGSMSINGANYNANTPIQLNVTGLATPTDFGLIKYTTDGTDPLSSGTAITGSSHPVLIPISQNATTAIKFFVEDLDGNRSVVQTETYIVDTKPVISAAPTSTTLNAGDSLDITLTASNLASPTDLAFIKYTLDGSDPHVAGNTYTGLVTLPQDQYTVLKFYGQHVDSTQSLDYQETYKVDTLDPQAGGFSVTPAQAKVDTVVEISFTVDEPLNGDPAVNVGGRSADLYSSAYPNYTYRYTVTGAEGEGSKTIQVDLTDAAGNSTSNGTQHVELDFAVPTYDPVLISPAMAVIGQPVEIIFKASEQLSSSTTVDIMSHSSTRVSEIPNGDGTYTYIYRSTNITGTEQTPLIIVHGYDLAGNSANSNDNWGNVIATGKDELGNSGQGTTTIEFDFVED